MGLRARILRSFTSCPRTAFTVPQVEPVQPIQDLVALALDRRPELAQQRVAA
jgi:hypothetical protein